MCKLLSSWAIRLDRPSCCHLFPLLVQTSTSSASMSATRRTYTLGRVALVDEHSSGDPGRSTLARGRRRPDLHPPFSVSGGVVPGGVIGAAAGGICQSYSSCLP